MTAQATAYIGEAAYGTGRCYDSIDPTTEKVIAAVADCSASDADTGVRSTVRRVPVGVVGCISPYNFPLLATALVLDCEPEPDND